MRRCVRNAEVTATTRRSTQYQRGLCIVPYITTSAMKCTKQLIGRTISSGSLQQIQALPREKESRSSAQQKIDSQLLFASKMRRGDAIAVGVLLREV